MRYLKMLACAAIGALCMIAGCTTTSITSPNGWSYSSTRVLNDSGLDEASIDPSTGGITIKGVRSDSTRVLVIPQAMIESVAP